MNHGIPEPHVHSIGQILRQHCPNIEKASLFGSRAQGTFQDNSDIDLVLYGLISQKECAHLHTVFLESLLPYKIDVLAYQHITHAPLKQHIDTVAQTLLSREQIYGT